MIEFHFCSQYKEKIEGLDYSATQKIYKKFQEYEKRDNLNNIGNIEPLIKDTYILKIKQPNSRIIIQVEEIDNMKVHFVRDIITNIKFDREYGRIMYGKIKKGEWLQENPLLDKEIYLFRTNYSTKSEKKISIDLQYPPEYLINWFSQFELKLNNEVFESEDWVEYALNNSIQSGMRENYTYLFRAELEKIINNKISCTAHINNKNIKTFICENNNIGIIYSTVELKNKVYYLLHFGSHIEEQKHYWNECIRKLDSIKALTIDTEDDLYRYSFRSYPKWTLNKESLWYKITKSEENSNLSLTTEQVEFLKTFKFPCYINGQAGSGKSTLLYYIFANIIYLKNLDSIKGEIIFLTENEQLLTNSSNNVFDLLENNPEFELSHEEIIENKKHFHSFKNFLLNMLDESDIENFKDDMYLHFPLFKIFYETSTIKSTIIKEYSAEEAWFVISTYIYGHDSDQKITSKNYEDLVHTKSRKIDTDRFKDIETYILPFYESLLEKGYWDKLKIIRYIDKNINLDLKTKYEVIICDEAQDFCKVELSFILKQSAYLKYDLSTIDQFPIVFAGDANQTVNPTGFSDSEMTSLLYQELKEIKFQYKSKDTFYSTNLNYRSNSQVVSLANFIQYYRMKNLDLVSNKKPQESKIFFTKSVKTYNIFLDYETIENIPKLKNALFDKLKYKIFIVPVNSEEKKEFKENSFLLSNFEDLEIKTSIESKGAEYKQVVLYGFGEYFLEHLGFDNQKNNFQVMYYFNKLYVGITRAKTELIIIDSKRSKEFFWEQLICKAEISNQNSWSKLKEVQSSVLLYNPDSINNILDSTKEDALENAKEDEKLGINYQNPARLKIAASQFSRLSKQKEAYKCLGFAEEINHNYKIAADYFQKSEELELASNAFFKGRFFNNLTAFGLNLQDIYHDIRVILSRLMLNEHITYKEIQELNTHKKIIFFTINDLSWRDDFIRILVSFIEKHKYDIDFRNHLIEIGTYIGKESDKELYKEIANINFIQHNYKDAIANWEKIDDYTSENYLIAKYEYYKKRNEIVNKTIFLNELVKFKDNDSDKIEIYNEIKDNYIEFEATEKKDSCNGFYLVVFEALVMTNELNNVINLNKFLKNEVYPSELEECYKLIIKNRIVSKKMFNFIILEWAKIIVSHEEFDNLLIDEVNSIYKEKSSVYNLSFSPYTVKEIEKFIQCDDEFEILPSEHLSHINIRNFRQFDNLTLDNLGRFNLIVGDNNVGKTSLLEALLFVNNEELFYKNLAFAYIARNNSPLIKKDDNQIKFDLTNNFIIDFFRNNDSTIPIRFELQEKRQQWNYSFKKPTTDEIIKENNSNNGIDENDYIGVTIDQNKIKLTNILNLVKNINPSEIIKMQFIPFGKGFDKNLAKSFYETIYRDKSKRELFETSMKVFIPNLDNIIVDTSTGKIEIEEKNKNEVFALHQYGEGANKLFRILIQIILQNNRKLLIDEIDAGIHYSHFSEFWNVILKVAYENNVQLFVTTHNLECIEYFKNTIDKNDEYKNISNIITIVKIDENCVKAYTRSYEEFGFELENNFEIRGGDL